MADYLFERFPAIDFDGRPVGIIVAKSTWIVGEDRVLRPSPEPEPVLFADVLLDGDDPTKSPALMESDSALVKDRTDVVIHAVAHAPEGRPVSSFDAEVVVGRFRRTLRLFGPRSASWRGSGKEARSGEGRTLPLFSDPAPVARVPVDAAHAYGGVARYRLPGGEDVLDIPSPVNPFGRGYCVQNSPEGVDGLALPQVEDPGRLLTPESLVRDLTRPDEVPYPAGLGVFGRSWYPRMAWAGVMPHDRDRVRDQLRDQAKKLDPAKDAETIAMLNEYDPPILAREFFQCAYPGMAAPLLAGDESVTLRNLSPEGGLSFNLPGRAPVIRIDRGGGFRGVPSVLDTLVFQVDARRLVLAWRARVPLEGDPGLEAFPLMPVEIEDADVATARRVSSDPA